jgi:hypothetical protein
MPITEHVHLARRMARERWRKSSLYDKAILSSSAICLTVTATYLSSHGNFILPDQFFVLVLVAAVLLGRVRAFLWDWLPLVVLLFGYDYVRGLVPLLNDHVYLTPMIDFDRFLFGSVPTIALQSRFYNPDLPHWYDFAAAILYFLHFIVPLTAAFLFWLWDRAMFREYAAAILILSYSAYLTYLAFPAAPPWLAAQSGLLPPVSRILESTLQQFPDPISLPTLYSKLRVNPVAAVPSLHAAYPLLMTLFVGRKWPKLAPVLAVYALAVWMAIVYLGEHYVFDIVTGVIYAVVMYLLVIYWPAIKTALARHKAAAPVS